MLINEFTGEIYNNVLHAMVTIVSDMVHYKKCRTMKMLSIRKYE